MSQAYKFISININKIKSDLKVAMLRQFLYDSEADIALLQEVITPNIFFPGFQYIENVAPELSTGTAILVREGIPISEVEKLETGRGISCRIYGVTVVNLYAPSGSGHKVDRSSFFKDDIIYLLRKNPPHIIIGGDFNCVLHQKDQRPHFNFCKELKDLVSNMKLKDTWELIYPTLVKPPVVAWIESTFHAI